MLRRPPLLLLACAATALVASAEAADAPGADARAIVEEALVANRPVTEVSEVTMRIVNERGQETQRRMRLAVRSAASGSRPALLVRFTAPAEVRRFGMLSLGDGDHGQWIYMPRADRIRRIAGGDRTSSFAGSDFTYEDLALGSLDDFTYRRLDDAEVEGRPCYVIEATPRGALAERSSYSRSRLYIRKDLRFAVQIELFDRAGTLVKVQENRDINELDGHVLARRMVMRDVRARTHTELKIENRRVNVDLPDRIFTQDELRRGS